METRRGYPALEVHQTEQRVKEVVGDSEVLRWKDGERIEEPLHFDNRETEETQQAQERVGDHLGILGEMLCRSVHH